MLQAGPISINNTGEFFFMHRGIQRGFTLLELIVVLIIVSLMSALVVPRLVGPMSNLDLKTASQKISASLRHVRSQAASEKATYLALFDFEKNRLVITHSTTSPLLTGDAYISDWEANAEMQTESPNREHDGPSGSKTYNLPDGIKLIQGVSRDGDFNSGVFRIFFYPSGGSSGGEITIANERGRQQKINIDFITGSVQLLEEAV